MDQQPHVTNHAEANFVGIIYKVFGDDVLAPPLVWFAMLALGGNHNYISIVATKENRELKRYYDKRIKNAVIDPTDDSVGAKIIKPLKIISRGL